MTIEFQYNHWYKCQLGQMPEDFENTMRNKPRGMKNNIAFKYLCHADASFHCYSDLINKGMKREDARGVLPLDTATEVIYTYSIDEWKHIINLRSDKKAHPNCQIIANMIKQQLEQLNYTL